MAPISPKSPKSLIDGNPVKYDTKLKGLIEKLDTIATYRAFRQWKGSFLRGFEKFLSEGGIEPANESYAAFSSNMEKFEKKVTLVQKLFNKGDISADRTTVKGRNAQNEMNTTISSIIREERELIPATAAEEKKKKYNKYHLGAILIRDGFKEYDRMIRCENMLNEMKEKGLTEIANPQQLEEINNYSAQINKFQKIMADLGLYEVMMKCGQFAEGVIDEIIFLDPKTKSIIEFSRDKVIEKGVLTITDDDNDKTCTIKEEEKSRVQQEELLEKIKTFY